jgi:hypothetical protein
VPDIVSTIQRVNEKAQRTLPTKIHFVHSGTAYELRTFRAYGSEEALSAYALSGKNAGPRTYLFSILPFGTLPNVCGTVFDMRRSLPTDLGKFRRQTAWAATDQAAITANAGGLSKDNIGWMPPT